MPHVGVLASSLFLDMMVPSSTIQSACCSPAQMCLAWGGTAANTSKFKLLDCTGRPLDGPATHRGSPQRAWPYSTSSRTMTDCCKCLRIISTNSVFTGGSLSACSRQFATGEMFLRGSRASQNPSLGLKPIPGWIHRSAGYEMDGLQSGESTNRFLGIFGCNTSAFCTTLPADSSSFFKEASLGASASASAKGRRARFHLCANCHGGNAAWPVEAEPSWAVPAPPPGNLAEPRTASDMASTSSQAGSREGSEAEQSGPRGERWSCAPGLGPVREERGASFVTGTSFYRSESALARDLSVLAAALHKKRTGQLRVLDVMSGSGVRGVRYLNQAKADFVWANDASRETDAALLDNLSGGKASPTDAEGHRHDGQLPERSKSEAEAGRHPDQQCEEAGFRAQEGKSWPVSASSGKRQDGGGEGAAADESRSWQLDTWHLQHQGQEGVGVEGGRWRVTHEDANRVLFHCYQVRDYYDLIDVDSFGSESLFLGSALMAVARGGLLYITCTDGFSAGGHAPFRALSAYGAYMRPLPFSNELGLRMLIGGAVREAALRGLQVEPVFSHYSFHGPVFRAMLRVASENQWKAQNYEFIAYCHSCGHSRTLSWQSLGKALCNCPAHNSEPRPMAVVGPLWTGPLHQREDVAAMAQLAEEWGWVEAPEVRAARSGSRPRGRTSRAEGRVGGIPADPRELGHLLEIMAEESDPRLPPWFLHLDKMSRIGRLNTPRRNDLIAALEKEGFAASRSHVRPNCVKTNCTMARCIEIARSLNPKVA